MSALPNLESQYVRVFPFGSERAAHPLDRVLNENNISALIRACTNDSDYVYYYDYYDDYYDADKTQPKIKNIGFFLHGYKFQIQLPENNAYTNLWVYINLTTPEGSAYEFLSGNDSTEKKFTGLHLVTDRGDITSSDGCILYSLQLIAKGQITNTSPTLFDRIYCGNSIELTGNEN